jgi:phage minor structural protein
MKLWILNRDEKIETILQNGSNPTILDAVHREQVNGENVLEFSVPVNHPKAQFVVEENIVLYQDIDGVWQEFVIKEIEDEHGEDFVRHAYCEHAYTELNDYIIRDIRPQDRDAEYMLNQILQKTRWSVGHVDGNETSTHVFYNKSTLQCIYEVVELFGGELRFRTEFTGSKITGRFVDLFSQRGQFRGKRFVYGKDVTNIKRTVDTSNLCTALIGRGKGEENEEGTGYGRKLDFTEVEWSVANGDPVDKPLGQDWVGTEEALKRYGRPDGQGGLIHRERVIEFEDEEDPVKLLERTWEAYQQLSQPIVSYELDVIDLETVEGHRHEAVRLGDEVVVIDRKFNPELRLKARVLEIERDLINPESTKVQIGNVQNPFQHVERQIDLEERVKDKPVPTSWLDGYIDAIRNEILAGAGTVRLTEGGMLNLDKPPDQNPTKAIFIGNGIVAVSNERLPGGDPSTVGGWDWSGGTFITGDGAFADKVVAGTMLADRVRGGQLYLGGVVNGIGQDGRFYLLNDENEIVCQMDSRTQGFDELFVGHIKGNNVVTKNYTNLTYYIDPDNGSDENDGTEFAPFATLKKLTDSLPEANNAYIVVEMKEGSEFNEVVELTGKFGSGIIEFRFNGSILNGHFRIGSCNHRIQLIGGTIVHDGVQHPQDSFVAACVRCYSSNWVVLQDMTLKAEGKASFCIQAEGANMEVINCQVYDATSAQIFASLGGTIHAVDNAGSGCNVNFRASGSGLISGYGTEPLGSHSTPGGGQITGTWSEASAGQKPSTGAQPGKGTWNTTGCGSYEPTYGWRTDSVYQGDPGSWAPQIGNYRGLWFFDYQNIRNALSGKTIKSIRIYLTRQSKGGYYSSRPLYFYTHNNTSASVGSPALSNSAGNLASFSPGESKWVELPKSFGEALKNGTARGIAIYDSSGSQQNYLLMSRSATLEIVYE